MKNKLLPVPVAATLLLAACVTINIYFPAAAAEQAADKIIKEIQTPADGETPQENNSHWQDGVYRWLDAALNLLVTPAHAGNADLSLDWPEISRLRAAMKKRFASLKPFYAKGWIGIQANGLLTVRNASQVPLRDRNRVQKLVAAENSDRKQLYRAIANANGHPEWTDDIQATFAKRWRANAEPGWWYQAADGSWWQK